MRSYLDGLIVDQRIDGNGSAFVVGSVGSLPELCSPGSGGDCKGSVGDHCSSGDDGELETVLVGLDKAKPSASQSHGCRRREAHQYTANQRNLESGGNDVKDHRGKQEAYSFGTTIDCSG